MKLQQPLQIDWQVTYHSQSCCWAPREMCNFPHTCHSQRSYNSHCPNDWSTSSDQYYRLSCRLIYKRMCVVNGMGGREKSGVTNTNIYTEQLDGSHASIGAEHDSFLPWEKGCMEHRKIRWCVYFPALLLHWLIDDQCIFYLTLQESIRTGG